ncbi:cAMP receptor protein [Roseovarius litorisediminis]|uniref:cAMP receptor protein n=1 Tax=Roseovarius litorisediminis TaxID=1312363 RepID=A0A1Y5SEV3_9RHOB|nr:Crp/Fnr family transcriptional regulator [Roseovarius litorisediminis]SLN39165.1 cAMP receptor protein [Roseovarius litorisediminis]
MSNDGNIPGGLGDRFQQLLADHGRQVKIAAGKTIFSTGDGDDTVMLIEQGRVEISRTSTSGRRSILTHLGPGEIVGELAVFDRAPRSADAVATTVVKGKVMNRATVMTLLKENPEAAINVIDVLCRRLRQTSATYTAYFTSDGQSRLALVLLRLFEKWGTQAEPDTIELTQVFSQSDLGDLAGLTRESVNRLIRDWENEGVLKRQSQRLILLKPKTLAAFAQKDD